MKAFVYTLLIVMLGFNLQAQQFNKKDSEGKKTGKWKQYHVNGKPRYTGQFVEGNATGTFVYYNAAGSIISKLIYSNNGDNANAKLYYPDGKIKATGLFVKKKKHGLWKFYHQRSGIKRAEESYKNGIKHGVWRVYFRDGKLSTEIYWKDGKRNGSYKEFFNSGEPMVIASYVNDLLDGPYISFHKHQIPSKKGNYKKGEKDGVWKYYSEKGKLRKKMYFNNGFLNKEEIFIEENRVPTDSIGDPAILKISPINY